MDDDGDDLDVARRRDRSARSPCAARTSSSGYLNRPDATAEAMRDGWFFTGDLATRAADGYLRIVGPPRHRPDQERRLQDRRGRDRDRAARAPGRRRGGGHRRARRRPRRADRRLGGAPRAASARRSASCSTTSRRPLTPHKRPREVRFLDELPAQRDGQGRQAAPRRTDPYSHPGTTKISHAIGGAMRIMLMPHCMSRLEDEVALLLAACSPRPARRWSRTGSSRPPRRRSTAR